jgi:hypothetical protein
MDDKLNLNSHDVREVKFLWTIPGFHLNTDFSVKLESEGIEM